MSSDVSNLSFGFKEFTFLRKKTGVRNLFLTSATDLLGVEGSHFLCLSAPVCKMGNFKKIFIMLLTLYLIKCLSTNGY